jgi:colicin import membrane protein
MHAANDRPEFAPPPEPALVRAFALAVLAHLVLLAALMVGLRWQRQAPDTVAEAELWSQLPVEAAPKPVPAPPPPPPPPPKPVVKPAPPPPPVQKQVDINIEKQRKLEEQRRQAELEREREEQKRKLEAQKKREQELAQKKLEEQKLAKLEEQKRKEEEKRRKLEEQQKEQQRLERVRKDQLARMQALAGATGSPDATGRAQHSAGPSASWAAKVQARVRPKIVFTDTVSGNPEAEIEVRTSPDGTIVAKRVVRSSGVQSWDEAVLRALDKTDALPRDVDGRVPSPVIIGFRPKG